jgi:hypothetical protein
MGTNLGRKKKNWTDPDQDATVSLMGVEVRNEDLGHNSVTYGNVEMMGEELTDDAVEAVEEGTEKDSYPRSTDEIYGEI